MISAEQRKRRDTGASGRLVSYEGNIRGASQQHALYSDWQIGSCRGIVCKSIQTLGRSRLCWILMLNSNRAHNISLIARSTYIVRLSSLSEYLIA